jgi:hypothetical protein
MIVLHFNSVTGKTTTVCDTSKVVTVDHDGRGVDGVDYYSAYTDGQEFYVIMTAEEVNLIKQA